MQQIPLTLTLPPSYDEASFVLGPANQSARDWLIKWPDWPLPYRAVNIFGPSGSGKTHLSCLWQGRQEAVLLTGLNIFDAEIFADNRHVLLDDFGQPDRYDDTALFHLFNHISSRSGTLLILSQQPVAHYQSSLSDVSSRLRSVAAQEIYLPDDELLRDVLAKHFADRQCAVTAQLLDYIVGRMERSFAAAQKTAADIDELALARKTPVNLSIVRQVLDSHDPKLI